MVTQFGGLTKINLQQLNMQKNIKLNMSRRIRRTPFTNKVEECGVSDFTVLIICFYQKDLKILLKKIIGI